MPLAPIPAFALLALALPVPQDPGSDSPVVARYLRAAKSAVITRDDLAEELSRRYGRTEQGKEAVEFLIGLQLVRTAAMKQGMLPSAAETQAWIVGLESKLKGAGMSLSALMAQKGMSRQDFEEYAALQLAHERLVRAALELEPKQRVTAEMLGLWLKEARGKQAVVTDGAKLGRGIRARVGDHSLTDLDVGRVLMRTAEIEQRHRFIRQIVLKYCLQAEAEKNGLTVTPTEMANEVAARRKEAEANPKYQGVPFEQLLTAQGTTIEELRRSPVLRAQIQERKLIAVLLPESELDRQLADDREAALRRHGARRRFQVLMTQAAAGKSGDATALQRIGQIRERIVREMPFEEAARTYSDDPYTKISGGDSGWHNREGSALPSAVVEAGYEIGVGDLSEPIHTDAGYYLVRVAAAEDEPSDATLKYRLRQAFARDLRGRLLDEAQIQFVDNPEPNR